MRVQAVSGIYPRCVQHNTVLLPSRYALFFTYVAILPGLWGVMLLASPASAHATVTAFFLEVFHFRLLVALMLLAASALSLWVVYKAPVYTWWTGFLLTPQALFILLAATGAVTAILNGEYADGVQRSSWFIAADQAPPVVAAVCHQWGMAKTHGQFIRRVLWKD